MGTSEDEEAQQRGATATLQHITVWRERVGSRQRKSSKTVKETVSRTVDQSQRTSVSLHWHCWQFAWTAFDSRSSGGKQVTTHWHATAAKVCAEDALVDLRWWFGEAVATLRCMTDENSGSAKVRGRYWITLEIKCDWKKIHATQNLDTKPFKQL